MLLKSEDEKQQKLGEAQSINQMVVCGMITLVTGLGVLVGPRLVATVSPAATSFFEKAATSSVSAELQASYQEGLLMGFEIGSLAQPWHGLIALVLICLCVIANDPFFGLCRLAMFTAGPESKKSISWEEAYGPLLRR